MSEKPGALSVGLEQVNPLCPTCGRLALRPFAWMSEWSTVDRFGWHLIACECGVRFLAKFYRVQS